MRYVVTGGAGFIGSHLAEYLVKMGREVVVLDDFSTGSLGNIASILDSIELVEGSVTDADVCEAVIDGADFVLHQAALPSVPRSVRDPVATHEVNATGTLNVLVAARHAGVRRVVFAASSSVYGNTPTLPKQEEMATQPLSPYAVSKLAAEGYCRAFHVAHRLETVALRYFNIFGPRQDPDSQYAGVIPRLITAAFENHSPVIFGDGEQTRDFTYVDNPVHANLLACEAPAEAAGQVFNVGCGQRISVNHLWACIRRLVGTSVAAKHAPARPSDVRDSQASIERANRVLGYTPKTDLRDGLERTLAFYAGSTVQPRSSLTLKGSATSKWRQQIRSDSRA